MNISIIVNLLSQASKCENLFCFGTIPLQFIPNYLIWISATAAAHFPIFYFIKCYWVFSCIFSPFIIWLLDDEKKMEKGRKKEIHKLFVEMNRLIHFHLICFSIFPLEPPRVPLIIPLYVCVIPLHLLLTQFIEFHWMRNSFIQLSHETVHRKYKKNWFTDTLAQME